MWCASLTAVLLPSHAMPLFLAPVRHVASECMGLSEGQPLPLQIGAAAFMGGATRMTLTTTVMVMETTGALQLIVPLMITVFVAKVLLRCALIVASHIQSMVHVVKVMMSLVLVCVHAAALPSAQATLYACP